MEEPIISGIRLWLMTHHGHLNKNIDFGYFSHE
jgi:hypothetical protein